MLWRGLDEGIPIFASNRLLPLDEVL